mgnify:FL=1|jgi:hypothetical protein
MHAGDPQEYVPLVDTVVVAINCPVTSSYRLIINLVTISVVLVTLIVYQ